MPSARATIRRNAPGDAEFRRRIETREKRLEQTSRALDALACGDGPFTDRVAGGSEAEDRR